MIDFIIIVMYIVLAAAIAAVLWSSLRAIIHRRGSSGRTHNIPVRRISLSLIAMVCAILLCTYVLGSISPITIGGVTYNDTATLRIASMFEWTTIIMIIITATVAAISFFKR